MKTLIRREAKHKVVAQLKLTGCPEGDVLNPPNPNSAVDRFFEGWNNALTPPSGWKMPSNLRIILDEGHPVLEYYPGTRYRPRCLVAGEDFWQDYTVECEMRIIGNVAKPNYDNSVHIFPWTGIMFRYQDLRHYYFFCLQNQPGDGKIVLYRRADNDWHVLAEINCQINVNKYYSLKVKLEGNRIHCYVDGSEVFRATDYLFKNGKTGVRFNTNSRVKNIKVTMTPGEETIFFNAKKKNEEELDETSEKYLKPVLWKKLDLSHYEPSRCLLTNLRSQKFKDILLFCDKPNPHVAAVDLEGQILWNREGSLGCPVIPYLPHFSFDRKASNVIYRPNGNVEIAGLTENQIVIFDGSTGETLKETPLPTPLAPDWRRWYIEVANIRGTPQPEDVILREETSHGAKGLWAYDDDLELLWKAKVKPDFGHSKAIAFHDIDGDGREEVLAGATLLDSEGEKIWRVEGYEKIVETHGAGHVDAVSMGNFSFDRDVDPVAFLLAGSAGVWVVDALTGKVRDVHHVGHAQGISVGNYRSDIQGLEILVGSRWDNYGILNLFSGRGERLLTFEPDNVSQGGLPVNWRGDGEELILLATSPKALGLWDGLGRKVITFPIEDLPATDFYFKSGNWSTCMNLHGDPRDEIIFYAQGKMHIFTQGEP